jgi:hypothetical protein
VDIDELAEAGVRWAVWNLLCYSRVSLDRAKEVFAALQWGERPEEGKLFEPARCQLAFPVKGPQFTKYVAMLDVARRRLRPSNGASRFVPFALEGLLST